MMRRAFTLIELLVVVSIIGILSALVVAQLGNAQGRARIAGAKNTVSEVRTAVLTYEVDGDGKAIMRALDPSPVNWTEGSACYTPTSPSSPLFGWCAGA